MEKSSKIHRLEYRSLIDVRPTWQGYTSSVRYLQLRTIFVPSPSYSMATASRKYKAFIAPDVVNGRSPFRRLQVRVYLLRDIALAPFLDTTALRV
ncbi:uncharacterized protein ARMOST_06159 [Armillaria ostoyae]|uniref:Uncharacterized protein n=1 Tax=Armillaria ostoyae TaxID=47428 RepID=A0A284R271_ARMOS|nr:uncharacterized protein ARMOST_06159 [Armillaria ostoyae]